jgi:phage/plasmid primase-like uncharacterized protein
MNHKERKSRPIRTAGSDNSGCVVASELSRPATKVKQKPENYFKQAAPGTLLPPVDVQARQANIDYKINQAALQAFAERGLVAPDVIVRTGCGKVWKRCKTIDKLHHQNGAYSAYPDYPFTILLENHADGQGVTRWVCHKDIHVTPDILAAMRARDAENKIICDQKAAADSATAQQRAWRFLRSCKPCTKHPYTSSKGFPKLAENLRLLQKDGWLVIVLFGEDGKATGGYQRIKWGVNPEEEGFVKLFAKGIAQAGTYAIIPPDNGIVKHIVVCEGYATGLSIHFAFPDYLIYCAMDAGNLVATAQIANRKYHTVSITIAADNDSNKVGINAALSAQKAVDAPSAAIAMPSLVGADWNDIHVEEGLAAMREQFKARNNDYPPSVRIFNSIDGVNNNEDTPIFNEDFYNMGDFETLSKKPPKTAQKDIHDADQKQYSENAAATNGGHTEAKRDKVENPEDDADITSGSNQNQKSIAKINAPAAAAPGTAKPDGSSPGGEQLAAQQAIDAAIKSVDDTVPFSDQDLLDALRPAAQVIGRYVASGAITHIAAQERIFKAGKKAGLIDEKINFTIKAGLDAGIIESAKKKQAEQSSLQSVRDEWQPIASVDKGSISDANADPDPSLPPLNAPLKNRQLGEGHAGLVMSHDPAPVDFGDLELPALATSWLPPTLKAFVDAASESLQVPAELAAFNALCATAIAMQAKIRVRINQDWTESLNLYVMAALPPGERKSATVELCKAPIVEWERSKGVELGDEIKRVKSDRKNIEKEIDLKRAKLGKATDANRQALYDDILNLEKKMPELLYTPRHLIDDVTPEGLAAFMDRHDDSAGAMQAEGGIIDAISGRYSKKPNLNIFLKAWDGESITVDRRQGDCFALAKPYLTLCVTAQPGVITELGITKGFKTFGLLDRFLYVVPKSWMGSRNQNPQGMTDSVRMKYAARIKDILDIRPQRDESGKIIQHELRLSEEAINLHNAFRTTIEPQLRENGELGAISGWGAKLPGHAARIAGLLHPWTSDTWQNEKISGGTMESALDIAMLLTAHTRHAFELMEIDPNIDCAKRILDWIKRNGKTTFTARDCWHGVKGRYKRMEAVAAGLEILQQRFFIFNETPAQRPSHRPSVTYRINESLSVGV